MMINGTQLILGTRVKKKITEFVPDVEFPPVTSVYRHPPPQKKKISMSPSRLILLETFLKESSAVYLCICF